MENDKRQPFKKYKELRISLGMGTHEATMVPYTHDRNAEQISDMVSNISITPNTGIVLTIKETGKHVHVKYNNHTFDYALCSAVLIFKDIELYTPFVYDPTDGEHKNHKWISWNEWESNDKYTTLNEIVVPWDERLSEHDTDLAFILSKVCLAMESASNGKANFKQNIVYDGNGYHIDMAYGECYCRANNGERYHIKHRYYASENTINVDIQHLGECNGVHEISFKFDDKHSLIEIKIKYGSIAGMLRFMDIDNTALREYINRIRDFINMKLKDHNLTTHIDDADGYTTQTWNFSPRVDISTKKKKKPTSEDIRKAMERGKAYDIEHTYFSTVIKYLFDEFGLTMDPSNIKGGFHGDASNNNENIYVSINKEACTASLSVSDRLDGKIVVKMGFNNENEFIDTVSVESTFKDYYDLSNSISPKTCTTLQGLRTLLKSATSTQFSFGVLDDHPFRLNMNGDIYGQISKECKRIIRSIRIRGFHHNPIDDNNWDAEIVYTTNTTVDAGILRISFMQLYKDHAHEKVQFVHVYVDDMYKHNICHIGIEFTKNLEVHSVSINPIHGKFIDTVNTIKEPQIRNLMTELFRLFDGPFA